MDLQKIVILCLAILVLGGGVWYLSQDGSDSKSATNSESEEIAELNKEEDKSLSGFGSFASLFGLGKNVTCEYSYSDEEGGEGSGTGYFAGDRMRVDSTITTDGETFDSSMINDGEFMYTWTSTSEGDFAMKMPIPEESEVSADYDYETTGMDDENNFNVDQQVEYDCDSWNVDPSVFVPPSNVEFMDMGAMMQEMMQGMPEGFEMPEGMELPEDFTMPQ